MTKQAMTDNAKEISRDRTLRVGKDGVSGPPEMKVCRQTPLKPSGHGQHNNAKLVTGKVRDQSGPLRQMSFFSRPDLPGNTPSVGEKGLAIWEEIKTRGFCHGPVLEINQDRVLPPE